MKKLKYKIYDNHFYISDEEHERRRQKYLRRYYFKHPEARIEKRELIRDTVITRTSFLQGPIRGAIHMREE